MGPKKLTPTQQMLMLRDMTERLGVLHEAQVLQIKLMPHAVDPGLTKSEASVDVEGKSITYTWERPEWNPDKGYLARLRGLADAVELFFGPAWHIKIIQNDVVLTIPPKTAKQSPKTRKRVRRTKPKRIKPRRR